jgi:VIT1/CCC1 family predicted Fe2+/Mn2+ transporter
MTRLILQDQAKALDTLAREELGVNPAELGSPWGAALSSFVAFAGGAFVPILPFLWSELPWQVGWSAVVAGVSLFAVGTLLSLFSGRNALWGGLRMVLIGGAAGVATHFIGKLLGVTLS